MKSTAASLWGIKFARCNRSICVCVHVFVYQNSENNVDQNDWLYDFENKETSVDRKRALIVGIDVVTVRDFMLTFCGVIKHVAVKFQQNKTESKYWEIECHKNPHNNKKKSRIFIIIKQARWTKQQRTRKEKKE